MLAATDMELSVAAYQERQLHEISPAGVAARAAKLRPAEQFRYEDGAWVPNPYIGHAVVTMVGSTPANAPLVGALASIQHGLLERLAAPRSFYPLPATSFHQTIANTLSADKHQRLVVDRGLAAEYPSIVTNTFADIPALAARESLTMRMVGLSIFGTAIGLLGVFDREEGFHRVLHFRDHFYGDVRLADLGIRRSLPATKVPAAALPQIARARAEHPVLDKMVTMREELRQLWLNTSFTREQLAAQLQSWCQRAEASGIAALQQFSQNLRAARA
jgi:hypothetical protein